MWFWSSFFGHTAANVYSEMKKEEKNNQRWNDLFDELGQYEKSFCDYLSSVGVDVLYVPDATCVDNGDISPEKRKMETVRRKVEQYIQSGGEPKCIHDLDKIDEYIAKVNYLNSKKCLYRQSEFQYDDLQQTKNQIEVQEKYLHEGINCLLNAKGNILKDILFEKYEEVNESVEKTKFVQVLTPDLAEKFLAEDDIDYDIDLLTINILFEEKRIVIYDWAKGYPIYYVYDYGQKIDMSIKYVLFCDESMCIVDYIGLKLMMSVEDAELLKSKQGLFNNKKYRDID